MSSSLGSDHERTSFDSVESFESEDPLKSDPSPSGSSSDSSMTSYPKKPESPRTQWSVGQTVSWLKTQEWLGPELLRLQQVVIEKQLTPYRLLKCADIPALQDLLEDAEGIT